MYTKLRNNTFISKLKSMLTVDFKRMFSMPLVYIMIGISFIAPILILVMTTMLDGTVTVDPQTGVETVIEGFDNVWQAIGSVSSENSAMNMSITGMCNINLVFFFIAVLVCVFISEDFRSGYSKNLFTVRPKKSDYVLSKFIVGFVGGASMLIAFFLGTIIGGAIANLPFDIGTFGVGGIIMSMLSKVFLVSIFVSIYVLASVFAKQKLWLSILLSIGVGMLFFTIIPIITPLDAGILNVILCLVGGAMFSALFVYLSTLILNKLDIL